MKKAKIHRARIRGYIVMISMKVMDFGDKTDNNYKISFELLKVSFIMMNP